jgi:glycosyltransferase involved in cell wall biosynthesis
MTAPKISIVLPTHNGSRFLDQSIESVVAQTCLDWELIVVNDASTDRTAAMIDRWVARDERITGVHLVTNRKLPGALNDGFARSRGEYHTWTSDDNWYHRDALARMLSVLEADPSVAIVNADATTVNEQGKPLKQAAAGGAEDLYIMNRIGACFLYRGAVTRALEGYDEHLFGAEDYDFWLRASLQFRFQRVAENLYFYRIQAGSLTARRSAMIATHVEQAVRRWLPQVSWPSDQVRFQAHVEWGLRCLRTGNFEEVFVPWSEQAPWLDADMRRRLRREILVRTTELAWEAYCRRDWKEVDRFRGYLREVSDDPKVARHLARRFYPRAVYWLKDRLASLRARSFF